MYLILVAYHDQEHRVTFSSAPDLATARSTVDQLWRSLGGTYAAVKGADGRIVFTRGAIAPESLAKIPEDWREIPAAVTRKPPLLLMGLVFASLASIAGIVVARRR